MQQLQELLKRLERHEPLPDLFGPDAKSIPVRDLAGAEVNTTTGDFRVLLSGPRQETLKLAIPGAASDFAEALKALRGWHATTRQESRVRITLTCWGMVLLFAAITAYFYFGIKHDFIHMGPAFLATIVNVLGLNGVLIVGGGLMLLAFGVWILGLVRPGAIVTLRPAS